MKVMKNMKASMGWRRASGLTQSVFMSFMTFMVPWLLAIEPA
jgi:hypothetical protein